MKNVYYFRSICALGGIETFFRELSLKYKDWDLTFVYQNADVHQLEEISQYCRCIKFNPGEWAASGRIIECDKAFFNFNLEFLDFVRAKENTLVVHGNYSWLKCPPPRDPRINRVVAVSKDSAKGYTDLTGIPCEVCYNPLNYEEHEKPLVVICACRLEDPIKGGTRTRKLLERMNSYCAGRGKSYICLLFSREHVNMPNVINMEPRIDIKPFMMMSDYLIQLSDNVEGYNYSVNEMLYLCNKPVVITPCNVYEELGIDDTMSIRLNFDMSNIDDVVDQMFTKKFKFKYKPPEDRWNELLEKGKSTYEGVVRMKIKVTKFYFDLQMNTLRHVGDVYTTNEERAKEIISKGYAEAIEEFKEEPKKKRK